MMQVKFLSPDEIVSDYPAMFQEVFGHEDEYQRPTVVMVVSDGDNLGLMSGYFKNSASFHVQYAGVWPQHRGGKSSYSVAIRWWKLGMQQINARWYFTNTFAEDKVSQKILLRIGFTVVGFIQEPDGGGMIQWRMRSNYERSKE